MNHPESFRFIVFLSVLVTMCLAEAIWPVRKWNHLRLKRWLFHGTLSVFNTFWTRLFCLTPILYWVHLLQEKNFGLSHLLGLSGTAEIIGTVVLFDGLDYWWHRWNHTVPFLWRFHRAHHLDTHVDVTTSLRFHPGELFLSYLAKSAWILIWSPSIQGFLIFEAGITAYSQFHHANINFPDSVEKILRWVHMTPRVHASHHTVSVRTRSANYSTIFLVWDRIFRTLKEPDYEEMKLLGLAEGRETDLSPLAFMRAPFVSAKQETG